MTIRPLVSATPRRAPGGLSLRAALLALPLVATCTPAAAPSSGPTAAPSASAPGAPTASAAAPSGSVAVGAASSAPPAPLAPVSASPGRVQCESVVCDRATELCCADPGAHVGRCVPKPAPGAEPACAEAEVARSCDESADCGAGSRCCSYYACTGGCPEEQKCEPGLCSWGPEACLPGGRCASDAFSCTAGPGDTQGQCRLAKEPLLTCGKERCGAGKACCRNVDTGRMGCADECPIADEPVVAYRCFSPADCGGYPCGANYAMTSIYGCEGTAVDPSVPVLCRTAADCPPVGAGRPACGPDSEWPGGPKRCVYALP